MKKCPFCAEQIQDEAVKCRFCNEFLQMRPKPEEEKRPWYFRTSTVVMAILCVMAFGLPLVWFNPFYSRKTKLVVSVIVIVITYVVWVATVQALQSLQAYYKVLMP